MDYAKESLKKHYEWKGKIEVVPRADVKTTEQLSLAYTPGVAQPCLEIKDDINKSYDLTRRWNLIAVVTDGSAVLGLGDIGPEAGMPVMEGKCVLFKAFADVDAFPLCIKSQNVDEIVNTIKLISGSFGGINLEDIASPRCFEIERRLKEETDIPIFHDDQHGTAVVALAAIINALKIVKKDLQDCKIVLAGAGAAGQAIALLLLKLGAQEILLCGRNGIISSDDPNIKPAHVDISKVTNRGRVKGTLAEALVDADIFLGVSAPGIVTKEMIQMMKEDPIVLAMSNPVPEIWPEDAIAAGAKIVGTGRSDFPNQINNVLAFPGIFRGALDVRASDINDEMKVEAAKAIASIVSDEELTPEYIIPKAFDLRVGKAVAKAVAEAARATGVARI
ncbi:MAG: NADP-dependent malic enzyme [Clostridiales bacterium]|jgi:malate dehydrogenase (oxaloacetate-decarboxylating)|nr:NADP-dependent malic enzyme [Clostridiales bacterium]